MIDVIVRLETARRAIQSALAVARQQDAPADVVNGLLSLLRRTMNLIRIAKGERLDNNVS